MTLKARDGPEHDGWQCAFHGVLAPRLDARLVGVRGPTQRPHAPGPVPPEVVIARRRRSGGLEEVEDGEGAHAPELGARVDETRVVGRVRDEVGELPTTRPQRGDGALGQPARDPPHPPGTVLVAARLVSSERREKARGGRVLAPREGDAVEAAAHAGPHEPSRTCGQPDPGRARDLQTQLPRARALGGERQLPGVEGRIGQGQSHGGRIARGASPRPGRFSGSYRSLTRRVVRWSRRTCSSRRSAWVSRT